MESDSSDDIYLFPDLYSPFDSRNDENKNNVIKLIEAARDGQTNTVQELLNSGTDINGYDSLTALFGASNEGHSDVVELLCRRGADVDIRDINGHTALMAAAAKGYSKIVEILLSHKANINGKDDYKQTALFYASGKGHTTVVELLCTRGANVDIPNINGRTALSAAAGEGHKECIEILLNQKAAINWQDIYQQTALLLSSFGGHADTIDFLCTQGAEIDIPNVHGGTALLAAAAGGHTKCVEILLGWNANINHQNKNKETALMFATVNGYTETMELLCRRGAEVNIPNDKAATALNITAQRGHTKCVKFLLDHEASINWQKGDGETPLFGACYNGKVDIVELLCIKGAEIDIPNNQGVTALLAAAQEGYTKCVELLLNHNVKLNQQDNVNGTALFRASFKGHTDVVGLLCARGASVDIPDIEGDTALLAAAAEGHTKCVEILLDHNANKNWQDDKTRTALYLASFYGHEDTVQLLCKRGVEVDIPCTKGSTALNVAAQNGYYKCVEILLDHNANINWQMEAKQTPLAFASFAGHSDIVELLCRRGAEVDIPNMYGATALTEAAANGNTKCVSILLNYKANINWQKNNGQTALLRASSKGNIDSVWLLCTRGANVDIPDKKGSRALHAAAKHGQNRCIDILLEHKANINIQDRLKNTALHLSSFHASTFELLCTRGANQTIRNHRGQLALDMKQQAIKQNTTDNVMTSDAFKRACRDGKTPYRYGRIMVTGKYGDGKTSLIHALLGKPIPEKHIPTDGLDTKHSCKVNIIKCTDDWSELLIDKTAIVHEDVASAIIKCEKDQQIQKNKPNIHESDIEMKDISKSSNGNNSGIGHVDCIEKAPEAKFTFQVNSFDQKLFDKVNKKKKASKKEKYKSKAIIFMWDFGGQDVYKNLHPLFLRTDCVHIVVYDQQKLENANKIEELKSYSDQIEFWLQMILSNCSKHDDKEMLPNVLLVGTHIDKLQGNNDDEKEARAVQLEQSLKDKLTGKKYKYFIADYYHVNSKGGIHVDRENFKKLKEGLIRCIRNCPNWEEERPIRYMRLLGKLFEQEEKPAQAIMAQEHVKQYADLFNISSEEDVNTFLRFHHATGDLTYFPSMADFVIINAQWLIDVFTKLITTHQYNNNKTNVDQLELERLTKEALIQRNSSFFTDSWNSFINHEGKSTDREKIEFLKQLMCRFHLMILLEDTDDYLCPSLLRECGAVSMSPQQARQSIYLKFHASLQNHGYYSKGSDTYDNFLPPSSFPTADLQISQPLDSTSNREIQKFVFLCGQR